MNSRNALIVFLTILFHAGTMPAFGTIWTVDNGGPADFATIQAAIADVGTVNGDEIVVQPGVYIEAINFLGKAVTLRSASGNPADTTINGNGAYHVVQFVNGEDPNTVIDGFTITGGNANGSYPDSFGSGIFIDGCSPTVTNCVLTGNYNAGTGTLFSYLGSPDISYCVFNNNTSVQYGGGMFLQNGNPVVTHCDFTNNQAKKGGGMCVYGSPNISDCTFTNNTATGNYPAVGGGIWLWAGSPTFTRCIFVGNNANQGGGIYNTGIIDMLDCKFYDNYSSHYGGGIANYGGYGTLTQCIFSGNRSDSYGGGVYNTLGSTPEITSCVFYGNIAVTYGGGIYGASNSPATIINSIFWNNSIDDIYAQSSNSRSLVSFSNIEKGFLLQGIDGGGNIGSSPFFYGIDPLFADANGADNIVGTEDDDFHLLFGSPSVDTGNNFAANLPATDLDGVLRILNGVIDMGPYELADCDGNGSIDPDSDLDGTPNECDVCPGFDDFLDSDGDTVPNGCDICIGDDTTGDTDGDGVCDNLDACPGFDDNLDDDNDGIINGCDMCFGNNATLDTDGDGICEDQDICPDANDNGPDGDNDGIADACDECSLIGDIDCDGIVDLFDMSLLGMHWLETL